MIQLFYFPEYLYFLFRNVRNIAKLNEQELKLGIFYEKRSWHAEYKDSAYIFIGK